MKKISLLFIIVCVSSALSGCFGPVKVSAPSRYTLTSHQKPLLASRQYSSTSLLVTAPNASPGYGTSAMVYTMVPYKLMSYADSVWVASPSQMFLPLLSSTIRQANLFKAVVSAPYPGYTRYTLNTTIETMQQEFLQPISQVKLVVLASVTDNTTQKVIASQRFSAQLPAPGNDAYSGVLSMNAAAGKVADQIAMFVKRSVH